MNALRWIAVLPASVLGGLFAYAIIQICGRGIEQEEVPIILRFMNCTVGHIVLGVAFVHCGSLVAPKHKDRTAYVLAIITLLLVGFLLFPSILLRRGWAIWGGICMAFGALFAAYYTYTQSRQGRNVI